MLLTFKNACYQQAHRRPDALISRSPDRTPCSSLIVCMRVGFIYIGHGDQHLLAPSSATTVS